jgi:hypothetical protein
MARKTTRAPRRPSAPPPSTRPQPRRPSGGVAVPAAAASPVVRSEEDYVNEYSYVKRDLTRIAVIAAVLFAVILAAPHFL